MSGSGIRRTIRYGLAVGLMIAVAGCGGASTPIPTYDLIAPKDFGRVRQARGLIAVAVPTALQSLDTEKIVVEPATGVVTYLGDAQWSDRLPKLLQARIVEAFENGARIRTVVRDGDRASADATLVTDIRQFSIQIVDGNPQAVVEISAKLIGLRGGRVGAGKIFSARVPAASAQGVGAANSLNDALQSVLVELVRWTATKI